MDQFMSRMNGCEKYGLVKTKDATKHFFGVTNVPWQIGVHKNLLSFLVKPNNGFAILEYL
jgi:hypothetical protein